MADHRAGVNKWMSSLQKKKVLTISITFISISLFMIFFGNDILRKQKRALRPAPKLPVKSLSKLSPTNTTRPPATTKNPPSYKEIMKSFLSFDTGPEITNQTWKGECPYPFWIPPIMKKQAWFQPYLQHLQRVNLSTSTYPLKKMRDCSRWWSATPQHLYDDPPATNQPYRGKKHLDEWKPKPTPPAGYKRPMCHGFGRKSVSQTSCATKHEVLWRTLDKLGILYFPRAGTDLGIARGSSYLTTDGDLDIHVDFPQKQLIAELKKALMPAPYLSIPRDASLRFKTEVHWNVPGCPAVHMCFNDWMEDEMSHTIPSQRAGHMDVCECLMNSVPLSCHKETIYRTWLFYGPSWRVPLHAKALDVPHRGRHYNIAEKLRRMLSKDGLIHEQTVRSLDERIKYADAEMKMILAQLNELSALIMCQTDSKCRNKLTWS